MSVARGRLAPSPTGRMHAGNVMTAIYTALSVRSKGGKLILRIEDIDPDRSRREYADALMDDLDFLGIGWDEGPYYQSGRSAIYEDALEKLGGIIYPCFCSRAELHAVSAPHASDGTYIYSGRCAGLSPAERAALAIRRRPALRISVPDEVIGFTDIRCGYTEQSLRRECGDFIVRRSDGAWAYQLAVTVDDALMGITEVVRGSDLLMSTPRQIWLHRMLGNEPPAYMHTPLLLSADGRRLAKRDNDPDMGDLRERYTSAEILGRFALLAGLTGEYMPLSFDELIPLYSPDKIPGHDMYIPQGLFDV